MEDDQQFCLRWNNHQSTLISVFDTLLENETLVDCTLAAEGKFLKAHKVVLSACSPYFATLLQEQYDKHPIFILKDVKYQELRAMMDYMYRGEVNISQDQLAALLKAAESLQIKGLSDNRSGSGPTAPKPESHHRGKHGGAYTLEQTKRARMTTGGGMDAQDVSGSREGSSSPSRRRRKVRRRSMENDVHDNSNSSVLQAAASNQSILQQQSAGLAASALVATQMPGSSGSNLIGGSSSSAAVANQATNQPLTSTNVTKKTESAKLTSTAAQGIPTAAGAAAASTSGSSSSGSGAGGVVNAGQQQQQQQQSDAINTENVQTISSAGGNPDVDELDVAAAVHTGVVVKQLAATIEKSNHKQQQQQQQQKNKDNSVSSVGSEMVIEPKAEYDDDAHDENVEDLTLDEEDMTMEELDQTAGTSQGGEGSSQAYATWQHDRSQDELGLMAGQDAQQRDPQDLSRKDFDERPSTSKASVVGLSSFKRNLLNTGQVNGDENGSRRKRLSVSEVSDMLFEFYKSKSAKVPKQAEPNQTGQISPTSGETLEPSSIAAIAVYGSASETATKNMQDDEMMQPSTSAAAAAAAAAALAAASFHPHLKYPIKPASTSTVPQIATNVGKGKITAIPTSVLVANTATTSATAAAAGAVAAAAATAPIAPTPANQATMLAEALMRNGLHNFQQQLRVQEILRQQRPISHPPRPAQVIPSGPGDSEDATPTQILESLLRRQQERDLRHSECENEPAYSSDDEGEDDEDNDGDDSSHAFDDIHLMEQANGRYGNTSLPLYPLNNVSVSVTVGPPPAMDAHAQALRNLEYTLSDYGGSSSNASTTSPNAVIGHDGEPAYECRHCGKKYRWKSTLRRHENVECGGKAPSHECPYCPYKSKQRGNLGVHVRKHHTDRPQLPSKRRSKYSSKNEGGGKKGNPNLNQSDEMVKYYVQSETKN